MVCQLALAAAGHQSFGLTRPLCLGKIDLTHGIFQFIDMKIIIKDILTDRSRVVFAHRDVKKKGKF